MRIGFLIVLLLTSCHTPAENLASTPKVIPRQRGRIVRLPRPGDPQIYLCHAPIPGLWPGEAYSQDAFTVMPFGVQANLNSNSREAGEIVDFDLSVDWNHGPPMVTALRAAPEDHKLTCPLLPESFLKGRQP